MAEGILRIAVDSKWCQLDGARAVWRAANDAARDGAVRGKAQKVSVVS